MSYRRHQTYQHPRVEARVVENECLDASVVPDQTLHVELERRDVILSRCLLLLHDEAETFLQ